MMEKAGIKSQATNLVSASAGPDPATTLMQCIETLNTCIRVIPIPNQRLVQSPCGLVHPSPVPQCPALLAALAGDPPPAPPAPVAAGTLEANLKWQSKGAQEFPHEPPQTNSSSPHG